MTLKEECFGGCSKECWISTTKFEDKNSLKIWSELTFVIKFVGLSMGMFSSIGTNRSYVSMSI